MIKRCRWCNLNNSKYIEYHDKEWCKPNFNEQYLYEMLKCLYRDNETCTFDPLCMNTSNGSCCACTYLDEVACEHFNKDLSRRLLYGYEEKGTDEKIINFWEEI